LTATEQKHILEEWLALHKGIVFKIVKAYSEDAAGQDDLFQEIIIQVWNSIPAFRKESAVTTWIYRVALNTAIKWMKKEKQHPDASPIDSIHHLLLENKNETDERLIWLYEEIARLDAVDRSVTLLMLDGFSYKEMASILGITESNVGVKINRIKKLLIEKSKKFNHGI
jgi:RNA polymerase sigma-70 factor, ECF subfamily